MIRSRFNKAAPAKGQPKFKNNRVETPDGKFDSQGEYKRWCSLKLMERAGMISDLHRQVPFELAPAVILGGRKKPAIRLVADFAYLLDGALVVEDFKSPITAEEPVFRLKLHLMKSVWDIDVKVVMK